MDEEKLVIIGKKKIEGEISAFGAKNAAFPVLFLLY
jgi:UDP-N-acetylglucosamine enolpyruvyl transferase